MRKGATGTGVGTAELRERIAGLQLTPDQVAARVAAIHREVIDRSPGIRNGNFRALGAADLSFLFQCYDRSFFAGALTRALGDDGHGRLGFRLSARMTSAGGKTYHYRYPSSRRGAGYEIAISTHLLFTNFNDGDRTAAVNGLLCRDRLEGLQRIFEHELIHLVELLLAGTTSCRRQAFRDRARAIFGHREAGHRLVTAREAALTRHGIRTGDRVAFLWAGNRWSGFVNRITQRATVLVPDRQGVRYSDGERYRKFYVPLGALVKEADGAARGGGAEAGDPCSTGC